MQRSFNNSDTHPIWSQQIAAAVDTASSKLLPALLLMEHAGIAIHAQVLQQGVAACRIVILVGGGNNGGDALVAARLLREYSPEVVLLNTKSRSELNAQQLRIYCAVTGQKVDDLCYRPGRLAKFASLPVFVIDGMVGLGWRGDARAEVREIITAVNSMTAARVLAVDIPSGLETDGSTSIGSVIKAEVTVTFGARKAAHVLAASRALCGTVHVADIGFPSQCVQAALDKHVPQLHWVEQQPLLASSPFAGLPATAHKYQRGHVLVIGGSRGKCGAPLLSGLAALRAGAGLVSVALDHDERQAVQLPLELTYEYFFRDGVVDSSQLANFVAARRVQVIVIGPGTVSAVVDDQLWQFLRTYTDAGGFVVIDAAAVTGVLQRQAKRGVLLTPHPGEWQRLAAAVPQPRTLELCAEVKRLAVAQGMNLVYKDASPLLFSAAVTDPTYVCAWGNNSLAKGGSGDVLCGFIAAYLLAWRAITPAFLTAYAQLVAQAEALSTVRGQHALLASDLLQQGEQIR